MARRITITDERRRDAQVAIEPPPGKTRWVYQDSSGHAVTSERFIKATEGHDLDALLAQYDDNAGVGQALIDGDPEIDLDFVGRRLDAVDKVWVRKDGSILYAARVLKVVTAPDGTETERADFVDVEANVGEDHTLPWTGKLLPIDTVVRRYALVRKVQLRHVNGLTFDFLHEIARTLQAQNKLLLQRTADNKPLIFGKNGAGYQGFLEGRADDRGFRLVLHLSNLELKAVAS